MNENPSPSNHHSAHQALQPLLDQYPLNVRVTFEGSSEQIHRILSQIAPRQDFHFSQAKIDPREAREFVRGLSKEAVADLKLTLKEMIRSSDKNKS